MARIGPYCKAYPVERFTEYPGWTPQTKDEATEQAGGDLSAGMPRIYFLHDNLVVTSGIWSDKDIVFTDTSDLWKEFCQNTLKFSPEI